jgi:MraZ protein
VVEHSHQWSIKHIRDTCGAAKWEIDQGGDFRVRVLKGEYFRSLDTKSRLAIPAKFRDAMLTPEEGFAFVAVRMFDGVLYLYTQKTYERILPHIETQLEVNEEVRNLKRLRYGLAQELEVDGLGRVLIPENVQKWCSLGKEVAILGVDDHIEVWDRTRWTAFVEEQLAQHDKLAQRVIVLQQQAATVATGPQEPK